MMPVASGTENPLVTIIVTTYNRADLVARAVKSVLAQTCARIDCLVVDDGSSDNTAEVLAAIADPRLRVIRHPQNRGSAAAKNTGLDNIRGEWFSFVDSDDEIVPEAIETLLRVPDTIDPAINKIECNAIDGATGLLSGQGLDHDQYLDIRTVMTQTTGDFWGITRTSILGTDRFTTELTGHETLLWNRIRRRAKEFYVHRGLLIWHRDKGDNITRARPAIKETAEEFRSFLPVQEYLDEYRTYRPDDFPGFCLRGMLFTLAMGDRPAARAYRQMLAGARPHAKHRILASVAWVAGPLAVRSGLTLLRKVKA